MGLRKLLENLNIIQALPDKPTNTATELKQQFDLSGNKIKTYINETLTEDLDSALSTINTTLSSKANSSDVYTKTATDALLQTKADSSTCISKGDLIFLSGEIEFDETTHCAEIEIPQELLYSQVKIISYSMATNVFDPDFYFTGNSGNKIVVHNKGSWTWCTYEIILMKIS